MNSSLKKTIQINPELFKIPGKNKTKNNREKSSKLEKPITPNLLKKQLLERIKNHKQKQERAAENKIYIYNVSKNNTKYTWSAIIFMNLWTI